MDDSRLRLYWSADPCRPMVGRDGDPREAVRVVSHRWLWQNE